MDQIKKNLQYIAYAGCALAILGCFLPFVKVSFLGISKSVAFTEGKGVFVIIAMAASAFLIFKKMKKQVIIPNAIALVLTLWDGIESISEVSIAHLAIGFYVVILGIVASSLYSLIKEEN